MTETAEPTEPSEQPGNGKPKKRRYTRHNLSPALAKLKLKGFGVIDRRTVAAREAYAFRNGLIQSLGGADELTPAKAKLIDMTSRAAAMLDHVDAWLLAQESLIDTETRSLLPVVRERSYIATHLAKCLGMLGLERVAKPIDLASYYAEAKPVDAQPAEPVEAARQPDVDADESNVEAEADADDADGADDLEPEPVVSEVVRQPVRRTQVGTEPTSNE